MGQLQHYKIGMITDKLYFNQHLSHLPANPKNKPIVD